MLKKPTLPPLSIENDQKENLDEFESADNLLSETVGLEKDHKKKNKVLDIVIEEEDTSENNHIEDEGNSDIIDSSMKKNDSNTDITINNIAIEDEFALHCAIELNEIMLLEKRILEDWNNPNFISDKSFYEQITLLEDRALKLESEISEYILQLSNRLSVLNRSVISSKITIPIIELKLTSEDDNDFFNSVDELL